MITQYFLNNTSSKLDAGVGSGTLIASLPTGNGALLWSSFPLKWVVQEFDTLGRVTKREFVRITGRTGDIINWVRAVEPCPASWDATTHTQTAFSFSDQAILSIIFSADDYETFKDEINAKVDAVGGLRSGFGSNKVVRINRTTWLEEAKNVTDGTNILSSDKIRLEKASGDYEDILYSNIKNDLWSAGKYIQTVQMWEVLWATNTIPDAIPNLTSNTGDSNYITSASSEYNASYYAAVAFNDNLSDGWASQWLTVNQWIKVVMPVARIFNAVSLMYWSAGEVYNTGWKIQGSNDGTNWTDLYTSIAPVPGTYTKYTFANTTPYTQYRFFGATGATGTNPGLKRINFDEVSSAPVPIAVVWAIQYPITLTSSSAGSYTNMGIAFSVPYACKIRTVKSWANASSGSAKIQLRDNSWTLLTEQTVANGTNSCDLNYDIVANTTYRLVLNDTVNFWNTGYYVVWTTFNTYFPYSTAWVYNAVTNDANHWSFSEINLDFLGKAFKARANRSVEIPFAVFAGFASGPKSIGNSVDLNGNDYSYIEWFSGLTRWDILYVSNIAGAISTTKGTVKNPIWQAVSSSGIVLKKTPNSVDNIISYSIPNAGIGVTNYGAIGWHYGGLCSYTISTSTGYLASSCTLQWSGDGVNNWKDIATASGNQTLQGSCSLPTWFIRGRQVSNNSSNASSITVTN